MTSSPDNNVAKQKVSFFSQELKLRFISAVIMAVIVLTITWIGGKTFALLWASVAFLVLWEFNRICSTSLGAGKKLMMYLTLFLIVVSWLIGDRSTALIMFAVSFAVFLIWELITNKTAWATLGLSYAALPFFAMSEMRSDTQNGLVIIMLLYFCVWGADVFAYFTGRTLGGPKLAPRISPNKTWSGFLGSLVGALLLSYLVDVAAGFEPLPIFFLIMLCVAIVSQLGDLAESSLKRKFQVKDSSRIIPGHGGVLDRVDGLVVAAVFIWVVTLITANQNGIVNDLPTVFVNAFLMP